MGFAPERSWRELEIVAEPLELLLKCFPSSHSALARGSTICNSQEPTRNRRFLIRLSIEKRTFWLICGHPGCCGQNGLWRNALFGRPAVIHLDSPRFAISGSRLEIDDFLSNCLLRNALFARSGCPDFCRYDLQCWGADSNLSIPY